MQYPFHASRPATYPRVDPMIAVHDPTCGDPHARGQPYVQRDFIRRRLRSAYVRERATYVCNSAGSLASIKECTMRKKNSETLDFEFTSPFYSSKVKREKFDTG